MLQTFNIYKLYFNRCISIIYTIILNNPNHNNYNDISNIIDINFRKFVDDNIYHSYNILLNCYELIEFLNNEEYIKKTENSFTDVEDAYHYLALITHFNRMNNKYNILNKNNSNEFFNLNNIKIALNNKEFI
jgi:hypothetical protein